ncbi:unnamed protein product [Anisakis simplex]|uniref:E3 ubiquitin-protein ligase listerin n=1 Tax=Anisakis simplex TaxID=6269 RepID=A0A3P6RXP6_ANISI|nr:unnamed protein product [Anisakis simplex]
MSRCELQCCASDATNSLVLLTCFVCEARTSFENSLFIFQGTEKEGNNEMNALNCALLRVLRCSCVALDVMESGLRDFLLCALITALEKTPDSVRNLYQTKIKFQSCKLESKRDEYSQLFVIFASLTKQLFIECVRIAESTVDDTNFSVFRQVNRFLDISSNLFQEWDEFYRKPAEAILIEWFVSLCDRETSSMHPALLRVLSSSMHFCKETTFLTVELPSRFDVELDCKKLVATYMLCLFLITVDMTLLENKSSVEDEKGAGKVEVLDEEEVDADERSETPDEKKVLPVAILRLINDDINYSSEAANKVGIAPLLLAWDALVETMARFKVSDRKEYCDSSNMLCIIEIVVAKIFDILPDSIPNIDEILLDHSLFRMEQSSHLEFSLVSQYAIGLFYRTLTTLPALVRQLYTSLPRSFSSVLANYTSRYLSPIIWRSERLLISQQKLPPSLQCYSLLFEVRVRSRAWEISAEYDMVDAKMALLISIPQDYPLSMPSFEYENAISNRELKNKWLLQLMLYFSSHNGSIMDGVLMWAGLVARHLDGVEDCMICMMTVHAKSLKLPRLKCGQCKKRFHVDCLVSFLFITADCSLCTIS